jgi:hypothetical protein
MCALNSTRQSGNGLSGGAGPVGKSDVPALPGDTFRNVGGPAPMIAHNAEREGAVAGLIRAEDVEKSFEVAVSELATALGKRRGPRVFSDHAVRELTIQQANFLEDMGLEAINLARRSQADVVSAADVRTAEATLREHGSSFPSRIREPLGGLLSGGGIAQLYAVLSAPKSAPPSTLSYLLAAISTIVGSAFSHLGWPVTSLSPNPKGLRVLGRAVAWWRFILTVNLLTQEFSDDGRGR